MTRYRHRPTEVEAVFWSGSNEAAVVEFVGFGIVWVGVNGEGHLWVGKSRAWCACPPGTWIIAEPDGSGFYPCDAATFDATYEVAE